MTTEERGFTILEFLIAIAVIGVVAASVMGVLIQFNREQALETETDRIVGILGEARSKTLYSQNASQYGVHIGTSTVVEFAGAAYQSSDPANIVFPLNASVAIATTSLTAGASDIVFDRLTGNAEATGTITTTLYANTSATHVIKVLGTGVTERIN